MKKVSKLEIFFWNMVKNEQKATPLHRLIYFFLYIVSLIYSLIIQILIKFRSINSYRPQPALISVGNITLGGTGKTPLILFLAGYYIKKDKKVGVLSRGFGRKAKDLLIVDGKNENVLHTGDEPLLIKNKYPQALVCVCSNRKEGVQKLESMGAEIILLDDGFQHTELAKDMDIIVLDHEQPLGNKYQIPRGNLRENISALKRGTHFLFCKKNISSRQKDLLESITGKKIYQCFYTLDYFFNTKKNIKADINDFKNLKLLALSGIAKPQSFFATLEKEGLKFKNIIFPDHHNFNKEDYEYINKFIDENSVDMILTTEKDYQRLLPEKIKKCIYLVSMHLEIPLEFLEELSQVV